MSCNLSKSFLSVPCQQYCFLAVFVMTWYLGTIGHWALQLLMRLGLDLMGAMVLYATYTMIHGQFLIGDWVILAEAARDKADHSRSQEAGTGWRTEESRPGYCQHYPVTRGRRITSWHRGVDRFVTREDIADHQQLTRTD